MLSEAQQFWDAIKGKVRQLIRSETENTYRCERYEVTTAPNGTKVGVTLPAGNNEIFLPYSAEVAGAAVGDPVMAVWWKSMSNAKVCWYADGYRGTNILYFPSQTVSAATNAQIMRIPASGTNSAITANSVVLECNFAAPQNITTNVNWTSYAGYISFTGTCTAVTTANVVVGRKAN